MKSGILIFLFTLLAIPFCVAQKNTELYKDNWRKIDSLLQTDLPKSAQKEIEKVYRLAKLNGQEVQQLKAQLYLMNTQNQEVKSDSPMVIVRMAKDELKTAKFPISNIWHSILGDVYRQYYQQQRYQIMNRTAVANVKEETSMMEWDARQFLKAIQQEYEASLAQPEALINTSLKPYAAIITESVNTETLRPTLYDLLAFRALEFYNQSEYGLTQPADQFGLDKAACFLPVAEFIKLKIPTTESSSGKWKTMKVYQQLLSLHLDKNQLLALLDADLQRLEYVYNNTAIADKDSFYKKALQEMAAAYPKEAAAGEALYRIQSIRYNKQVQSRSGQEGKQELRKDLPEIKANLEAIVERYPNTEGGVHAQNLITQITTKNLSTETEQVVLPDEPFLVKVNYRNVEKAWFRIVKAAVPEDDYEQPETRKKKIKKLLDADILWSYETQLPGIGDYNVHSTEIKADALPYGSYALLSAENADFDYDENRIAIGYFQVSSIGITLLPESKSDVSGVVMDRKTGKPLKNISLKLFGNKDRDNKEFTNTIKTSADGRFTFALNTSMVRKITATNGQDIFVNTGYYSMREMGNWEDVEDDTTVHFFTDRNIYRPGQVVYFKGIVVRKEGKAEKSSVVPNYKTTVLLNDANYTEVETLNVVTNSFGSFSGSFKLPTKGMTGEWTLDNADFEGEARISVEEYKRPKFEVVFDTLKDAYPLNEEVKVKGKAMSFAGAPIDGASVKYSVKRQQRWPWWGGYSRSFYPSGSGMEITNGTTTTDAEGRYEISFLTKPDGEIDSNTNPMFQFEVTADVTDITGETQSNSTTVVSAYTSLQLSISISSPANFKDVDSFKVLSTNTNGVFTPAEVTVTILKLKAPSQLLRKRLWTIPDQYLLDSVTFKKYFPNDAYRNENDKSTWAETRILTLTKTTKEDEVFGLPRSAFKENGWYRIRIISRDNNGKKVEVETEVRLMENSLESRLFSPLEIRQTSIAKQPGDKVEWEVSSKTIGSNSTNPVYVFGVVQNDKETTLSVKEIKDTKVAGWQYQLPAESKGSVHLLTWTVINNRVYQGLNTARVPVQKQGLDIAWASHRDKLLPGEKETWTMTIKGADGDKVAAEMVASLYDASLDKLKEHEWEIFRDAPSDYRDGYGLMPIIVPLNFNQKWSIAINSELDKRFQYDKQYASLISYDGNISRYYRNRSAMADGRLMKSEKPMEVMAVMDSAGEFSENINLEKGEHSGISPEAAPSSPIPPITPRKNLNETAFFFPQLQTDKNGNVVLNFTMPEALTQWRLLAFAHTKDMQTGKLEGSIRTQKDLMVVPGIPRFLRQGDELNITAKINNLSGKMLNGTATLEVLDAETLQPLHTAFNITNADRPFSNNPADGASTVVSWNLRVPQSRYMPVVLRITARAGNFTDGEDNALPVLTNRTLITETMPIWLNGNQKEKTFDFKPVATTSSTIAPHALTVEYTSNPAWLAVQALPYLVDFPYECAEQTFNRYYANALAEHIANKSPKLKAIFAQWQKEDEKKVGAALLSKLELNQELKAALLEETPWVLQAKDEAEQKRQIATLFNSANMAAGRKTALEKLKEMQLGDGGFPWFRGYQADRYITQYIAIGIARLQKLGVETSDSRDILTKAQAYGNSALVKDYQRLLFDKADTTNNQISAIQVQQLYLNQLHLAKENKELNTVLSFYKKQAKKYWPSFNPATKAMTAMALEGDGKTSTQIFASLRETAISNEETGTYWVRPGYSWYWQDAPIETQALMIEAFSSIRDNAVVDASRRWLLKQKQTQHWATTKATADACYALLLQGNDWLSAQPTVRITLGDTIISSATQKNEAGTGYFKTSIARESIKSSMSKIALSVDNAAQSGSSWGAVYYQYFEDIDLVQSSYDKARPRTPLAVKKHFFITRKNKTGDVLEEITEGNAMKVGDKITVRIILSADREMDYVHLKDSRPSCFEPINVLSGYRYQNGLGYYESTRDASSNFFISTLRKGTYVFEYPVYVTQKGNFSAGMAEAQCMYAPEFSSHSAGSRVVVE